MAKLTLFKSPYEAKPAITDTRVDPELAGSGYGQQAKLAEQTQQHLARANEIQQQGIRSFLESMDKRDELTYWQGRLDLQAKAYDLRNKFQSDPRPVSEKMPEYQQQLGQLAQGYTDQISNPFTQGRMMAESNILGAHMAGHMQAVGQQQAQEQYMQQMKNTMSKYSTILYDNPSMLPEVQSEFKNLSDAAKANGMNPFHLDKINQHLNHQMQMAAWSGQASKDPQSTLQAIQNGALDDQGFGIRAHIANLAQSTIKGNQAQSQQELKLLGKQLMTQGPIPDNYDDVVNRAAIQGLDKDVQAMDIAKNLKQELGGLPLAAQVGTYNDWMNQQAANPSLDPTQYNFVKKVIEGQVKTAQQDPLHYATAVGGIGDIGDVVTDPKNPDFGTFISKRMNAVEKAKSMLGVPVGPLTQDETKQLAKTLPQMPVDQQSKVLQMFSNFDPKDSGINIQELSKHNPVFASAASIARVDPETATNVLNGQIALKSKAAMLPPEEVKSQAVRDTFGQMYTDQADQLKQLVPAADALYAHEFLSKGTNAVYADALKKVSGASDVFGHWFSGIPGYKTLLPHGVDSKTFEKTLTDLTPDQIPNYSNSTAARYADGTALNRDQLLQYQATPVAEGQYIFKKGSETLMSDDLKTPFTLDIGKMASDMSGTPTTGAISGPGPIPTDPTQQPAE